MADMSESELAAAWAAPRAAVLYCPVDGCTFLGAANGTLRRAADGRLRRCCPDHTAEADHYDGSL